MSEENLLDMSRAELVHIAAEQKIDGANKMNKVELLAALTPSTTEAEAVATQVAEDVAEAPEAPVEPTEASQEPWIPSPEEVQAARDSVEADEEEKDEPLPAVFYGAPTGRWVQQKAVLYTDGVSGVADLNHERAYEYNERFQSSDSNERITGDVSLSEAAKEQKEDIDRRRAEYVKRQNN